MLAVSADHSGFVVNRNDLTRGRLEDVVRDESIVRECRECCNDDIDESKRSKVMMRFCQKLDSILQLPSLIRNRASLERRSAANCHLSIAGIIRLPADLSMQVGCISRSQRLHRQQGYLLD